MNDLFNIKDNVTVITGGKEKKKKKIKSGEEMLKTPATL